MMRYFVIGIVAVLACALLCGCSGAKKQTSEMGEMLYAPQDAVGFDIVKVGTSSVLNVKNPWQGAQGVDMKLFISRNGERPEEGFDGVVVDAPIRRIVCMSSSYTAFIEALGELPAVIGVSGGRFISSDSLRVSFERGDIREVGYDSGVNYELIASLKPDLVLVYGVAGENSVMTDKLRELSVNVMYIADYLETTPLGKAEWIVAFGEMFDKRESAQQIFTKVKQEYCATRELVAKVDERPKVMLNAPWRDTWFVPGDRSYIVQLIADAGGVYACAGVDSDKSRPISAETAYVIASTSDVWLNPNQATTIEELVSLNPKFKSIPPIINSQVYNCNKRSTPDGGSDFWESGAVYPNVVLKDMIEVLHPGLLESYTPYYFFKLE